MGLIPREHDSESSKVMVEGSLFISEGEEKWNGFLEISEYLLFLAFWMVYYLAEEYSEFPYLKILKGPLWSTELCM